MNEFYSSLFLLISEVGLILFLILGTILFLSKKRKIKDKALAMVLVDKIKNAEPEKREKLLDMLKNEYGYDEEKAQEKIEAMIGSEKVLYGNLLKIFLKKDRDKISDFDKNLNDLIASYQSVNKNGDNDGKSGDDKGKGSKVVLMREENSNLREANAKLKRDLDAAMQTMESMMSEYASMYEGGQKDGEQRMKNEMFKLRQVMEKKPEEDDLVDEVGDLDIVIDEIDLDEKGEPEK